MRSITMALGFVAVGLGVIGAFVPILPTTPFSLLAAACFAKTSDRFHTWLLSHRYLGEYIRNYRKRRGMSKVSKVTSLTMLWATIGYSVINAVVSPLAKCLLLIVALGVTTHVLALPTAPRRPKQRN